MFCEGNTFEKGLIILIKTQYIGIHLAMIISARTIRDKQILKFSFIIAFIL